MVSRLVSFASVVTVRLAGRALTLFRLGAVVSKLGKAGQVGMAVVSRRRIMLSKSC